MVGLKTRNCHCSMSHCGVMKLSIVLSFNWLFSVEDKRYFFLWTKVSLSMALPIKWDLKTVVGHRYLFLYRYWSPPKDHFIGDANQHFNTRENYLTESFVPILFWSFWRNNTITCLVWDLMWRKRFPSKCWNMLDVTPHSLLWILWFYQDRPSVASPL